MNRNDLADRTLRIVNFNGDKISKQLLQELFIQAGPVVNVVHRQDHAFIEFEDESSVAYALALFEGVCLFEEPLQIEPKAPNPETYRYVQAFQDYKQKQQSQSQFLRRVRPESSSRNHLERQPRRYEPRHFDSRHYEASRYDARQHEHRHFDNRYNNYSQRNEHRYHPYNDRQYGERNKYYNHR